MSSARLLSSVKRACQTGPLSPWRPQLQGRALCAQRDPNAAQGSGGTPPTEELPDPPNAFETVGAMGFGAMGALAVAGLGVVGVFKLALWVAGEAGRPMRGAPQEQADTAPPSA